MPTLPKTHASHKASHRDPQQIDNNKASAHTVANKRQIDLETLQDLIDGKTWPDLITVAASRSTSDRRLSGNEHNLRI